MKRLGLTRLSGTGGAAKRKRRAQFPKWGTICLGLAASFWPICGRGAGTLEYAVKATFLCKFPAFVTWPSAALPASTFVICVAGNSPFGNVLNEAASGQSVQGRPIFIRYLPNVTTPAGCQVIYLAGSGDQPVAAGLAALRGAPVLTVTDGIGPAAAAGMINFVVEDGYVRFEIDPSLAKQSGLAISSKLLSLASRIRTADAP